VDNAIYVLKEIQIGADTSKY
jgi:mitosis inhibitor protein kinase SWE1